MLLVKNAAPIVDSWHNISSVRLCPVHLVNRQDHAVHLRLSLALGKGPLHLGCGSYLVIEELSLNEPQHKAGFSGSHVTKQHKLGLLKAARVNHCVRLFALQKLWLVRKYENRYPKTPGYRGSSPTTRGPQYM